RLLSRPSPVAAQPADPQAAGNSVGEGTFRPVRRFTSSTSSAESRFHEHPLLLGRAARAGARRCRARPDARPRDPSLRRRRRGTAAAEGAQAQPRFGDGGPAQRPFPSRIVRDGGSVTFDGATFFVHALGPGESYNDSYWVLQGRRGTRRNPGTPGAAFIGDVVLNGVHAYMADGHTAGWLANIERVRDALAPDMAVYPGHGDPGGPDMLVWESSYLTTYRSAVAMLAR